MNVCIQIAQLKQKKIFKVSLQKGRRQRKPHVIVQKIGEKQQAQRCIEKKLEDGRRRIIRTRNAEGEKAKTHDPGNHDDTQNPTNLKVEVRPILEKDRFHFNPKKECSNYCTIYSSHTSKYVKCLKPSGQNRETERYQNCQPWIMKNRKFQKNIYFSLTVWINLKDENTPSHLTCLLAISMQVRRTWNSRLIPVWESTSKVYYHLLI